MKYYKVVKIKDDQLVSACRREDEYRTEYKVGKFVTSPDKTPLFVFKDYDASVKFASSLSRASVYECQVSGKVIAIKRICNWVNNITVFWKCKNKKTRVTVGTMRAIKGTVVVDKVKLTKLVEVV